MVLRVGGLADPSRSAKGVARAGNEELIWGMHNAF